MAREKKTYVRPEPAHRRLTGKQLDNVWASQGLVAQTPVEQDPEAEHYNGYSAFDASFEGAVDKTVQSFQTVRERREAEFQARRQRQAQQAGTSSARTQKPRGSVAVVAEDLAGEAMAAERKAMLDAMSPEERNAILGDLLNRERDETQAMTSLEDDDQLDDFNWVDYQAEQDRAAELAQQDGIGALAQDLSDEAWGGVVEGGDE